MTITIRLLAAATAFATSALLAGTASAQIDPGDAGLGTKLGLQSQNNSGEVGTVTLFKRGASTLVVLALQSAPAGAQPAHIHRGKSCSTLDPVPAFPLANVVNGRSKTIVHASESKLLSGNYVVNVHQSLANAKRYVACGELYQ